MRDDRKTPDFRMVKADPPPRLVSASKEQAMHDNIAAVAKKADGAWYRVGRFTNRSGARNRAMTLRKKEEYSMFEFTTALLEDDPEYQSALFCRWEGVVGNPPRSKTEGLRVVPGEGGDDAKGRRAK